MKLDEAAKLNDTLNPKIWNIEDNTILPDVADKLNEIVSEFVAESELLSIEDIIDAEIVGSNASYNYGDKSDLDLHLVIDMESISHDVDIVQLACNSEKSNFNNDYDIYIHGVKVELYVEDVKASTASNGVYSLFNEEWIKVPQRIDIPDYSDDEEYKTMLGRWMTRTQGALRSENYSIVKSCIGEIYNLRRTSIMKDGEYSKGNLVFKEIRDQGILQGLKDLAHKLASKKLSLESFGHKSEGFSGVYYTEEELKDFVTEYIEDIIEDAGIDTSIIGMEFIGSRVRGDNRDDSDLDVVVEFEDTGDVTEDGLFNTLNDEDDRLYIDDIPVDINPILAGKSGDLDQYIQKVNDFDKNNI